MANEKWIVGGLRWSRCGERKRVTCTLCGRLCIRVANVTGPTNVAMGMFGVTSVHDLFECPNDGAEWHNKIARLHYEAAETSSRSVRALIERDIDQLLVENLASRSFRRRAAERLRRYSRRLLSARPRVRKSARTSSRRRG